MFAVQFHEIFSVDILFLQFRKIQKTKKKMRTMDGGWEQNSQLGRKMKPSPYLLHILAVQHHDYTSLCLLVMREEAWFSSEGKYIKYMKPDIYIYSYLANAARLYKFSRRTSVEELKLVISHIRGDFFFTQSSGDNSNALLQCQQLLNFHKE